MSLQIVADILPAEYRHLFVGNYTSLVSITVDSDKEI